MSIFLTKYSGCGTLVGMKMEVLKHTGLSEKSAKVYLAALSLGTATVQEIAVKAGLKRPTVYIHVEDLLNEGLLSRLPVGKKDYFKAADPKVLEKRSAAHLEELRKTLPDLELLHATKQGRPNVSILEGRKALEQVYRDICEANSIRFWSDLSSVEELFQEMFVKIAEAVNKNEIRCREIIADTPEARKSSKRYAATAGHTYSSRIAGKTPGIFNDNAIYGDTVAFFRLHRATLFVILIKEPTIAETLKTLFDMAWETGKPFVGR